MKKRLRREVHHRCPLCGGIPLVCAHTIKKNNEVRWNYEYLLAICEECERKVESGAIDRNYLHTLKNTLRKYFPFSKDLLPHNIKSISSTNIYLGNNHVSTTGVIFMYRGLPTFWIEEEMGVLTLNARFYDQSGMVVTAIDKNVWTADRERFYDFRSKKDGDQQIIKIIGKNNNDTSIELSLGPKGLTVHSSTFYVPGHKICLLVNGDMTIDTATISNCSINSCGAAFSFD